jgi:hypothetical protein
MLRLAEIAVIKLTVFLILCIFLVQVVWAHVMEMKLDKPTHTISAPMVQQQRKGNPE